MKLTYLPIWATGLLLSLSLLTSCQEGLENTVPASEAVVTPSDTNQRNAEEAYPGITKEGVLNGQPIKYLEKNGHAVWQGDILLSPAQLACTSHNSPGQSADLGKNARTEGAGMTNKDRRWTDFIIPYKIATGVNGNVIQNAINAWQSSTPLRFIPCTNQTDYVRSCSLNLFTFQNPPMADIEAFV